MNIRAALKAFLSEQTDIVEIVGNRVYPVIRPQDTSAPCVVFRVIKGEDGEAIDGDTGERVYSFEIVCWARDYLAAAGMGDLLRQLFHGTGNYLMDDIRINESWKTGEYDGDRVTDTYSDAGDYAVTFIYEFHWVST